MVIAAASGIAEKGHHREVKKNDVFRIGLPASWRPSPGAEEE
jgi:hypothetical protein